MRWWPVGGVVLWWTVACLFAGAARRPPWRENLGAARAGGERLGGRSAAGAQCHVVNVATFPTDADALTFSAARLSVARECLNSLMPSHFSSETPGNPGEDLELRAPRNSADCRGLDSRPRNAAREGVGGRSLPTPLVWRSKVQARKACQTLPPTHRAQQRPPMGSSPSADGGVAIHAVSGVSRAP